MLPLEGYFKLLEEAEHAMEGSHLCVKGCACLLMIQGLSLNLGVN